MTTHLKVREDGQSVMAISAGTPPPGERPRYRTLAAWQESAADFEAAAKEPPPLDHRRVFDRFNAVPKGTTAAKERAAAEDESAPKAEAIDVEAIYRTFNNPGKRSG